MPVRIRGNAVIGLAFILLTDRYIYNLTYAVFVILLMAIITTKHNNRSLFLKMCIVKADSQMREALPRIGFYYIMLTAVKMPCFAMTRSRVIHLIRSNEVSPRFAMTRKRVIHFEPFPFLYNTIFTLKGK